MLNTINTQTEQKEACLTLLDAEPIFSPMLSHGFTFFLQELGLADDDGIPHDNEYIKNCFKSTTVELEDVGYLLKGRRYFITESGINALFNIALNRYLREHLDSVEL